MRTFSRELKAINKIRKELNIGRALFCLPKGKCGSPRFCVVARALHGGVFSMGGPEFGYRVEKGALSYPLPLILSRFVDRFDLARYPELIA